MPCTLITRRILVAVALLAMAASCAARASGAPLPTPQFRSYALHEGLPSSEVHAVAQDAQGFIWVATSVGVARFDGVEFTVPRAGPEGTGSLPSGAVTSLLFDRADRLWMGGAEIGMVRYDPASKHVVQWHPTAADGVITALAQGGNDTLWVGTTTGLFFLRDDSRGLERVAAGHAQAAPEGPVLALHAAVDGHLWVGTDSGLQIIDPSGGRHVASFGDGMPHRVLSISGRGVDIHVSTSRGLYLFSSTAGHGTAKLLRGSPTYATLADSHGVLWLAGLQGLTMRDPHGRQHDIPGAWQVRGGLPGRTVRSMIEDREHGLWFALNDGGLAYLGPSWGDFTVFRHVATDPLSFPGSTVTAVARRGTGRLWVGGLRGWVRSFDPSQGATGSGFDLGASRIQSLLGLPGERVLIGTVEGLTLGSGHDATPLLRETIDRPVTAMAEAPLDDAIFVAALGRGIFRVDRALRRATAVPFRELPRGWADTRQIEIVDGDLWQASVAGLLRRDRASGQMHFIEGVPRGRVSAFEPDTTGFWVVRPDALEHYHWQGARAVRDRWINGSGGFPSADILNVRRDASGRLWLYGQTGVWRFDPAVGSFRPFGLADGLARGEFTNATTVQLEDGSMYGATLDGLVGFRPDSQRDHVRQPPLVVLGASVWRSGSRVTLPLDGTSLALRWDDRDLRVRARLLSYVNAHRNLLYFTLEDEAGVTTTHRTGMTGEATFDVVRSGLSRLTVAGAGGDGVESTPHPPISIYRDAPPWLRWWAWLAYAAIAAGIITGVVFATRYRLRQAMRVRLAEQQQCMAEAANAAKTQFMAVLGHEIRTPMTGVLGMAELMSRTSLDATQRAYVDAVQQSGSTLLRLVNDALDIARIESGGLVLDTGCVSPRALAGDVMALASGSALAKGLRLDTIVEPDVPDAIHGDGVRLRQILQNLVGNAVKFTVSGSVSLTVGRDGDTLLLTVADTGPGMSRDVCARVFARFEQGGPGERAQGAGLGLAICRELCALMQGSVDVSSEPGRGSIFVARLPLVTCACRDRRDDPARRVAGPVAPRTVLLVEDDPVVADVIARLLRERGHHVSLAVDGLSAIAELGRQRHDALLLDLDLPLMNGFQLARLVRRVAGYANVPIIAVTARSSGDEPAAIRAAGMDALVRKPMTGDELEAVLAGVARPAVASLSESPEVRERADHQQCRG